MNFQFNEIDPESARQFIEEVGHAEFDNIARIMMRSARQHLASLEAGNFGCNSEEMARIANSLANLLAQFGFVALSKRVTIYEFMPHYLTRTTFAELSNRLEAGIEELETLIDATRFREHASPASQTQSTAPIT